MSGENVSLLQYHGLDHIIYSPLETESAFTLQMFQIVSFYMMMIQRQCIGRKYRSRDCLDRNHFNYSKIEYICQEGEPVDGTDFQSAHLDDFNDV